MAENVTLARPYAEAAFALARESGQLGAWAQALSRLAVVASDANAIAAIGNPHATHEAICSLLTESAAASGSVSEEQKNFVRVLAANGRARLLPEINELFITLKNASEGVKEAVVSSAFELDEAQKAQLASDLESRFGKLHIAVQIDPALIGGVRIAVGDEVIDASVRGKLAAMAAALQN